MKNCPFCEMVKERYSFIEIAPRIMGFPPLNPVVPGHLLIAPMWHVKDAAEDPVTTGAVMEAAARVAKQCDSANIITSIGSEATQTIFHLHVHVVPRKKDDGLHLPWTGQVIK